MPKGNSQNEDIIEEEDKTITDMHMALGQDLEKIHDIMHKTIKQQI